MLVSLPTWLVAYFHAPQLDMNTVGYPLRIALALVGGYYVQTTEIAATAVGFAAVFLVLLSGVKVIDDAKDYEYDHSIGKKTVAVVLGQKRARWSAHLLWHSRSVVCSPARFLDSFHRVRFSPSSPLGGVALAASRLEPRRATEVLMRGSHLFLRLLFLAVLFRLLS